MDVEGTVRCPVCEYPVQDYEPGVSSVLVDGVKVHPACAKAEGLTPNDAEEPSAEAPDCYPEPREGR